MASWRRDNPESFKNFLYVKLPRNRDEEWAYNIGFCLTRGEFIAMQNSDDISHKERINTLIMHLSKHPETAVVGSRYLCFIGGNINDTMDDANWLCYDRDEITEYYTKFQHCVCTGTTLFRAVVLEEVIGMKKVLYGKNDWFFLSEMVQHEFVIDNLKQVLFYYRKHKEQKIKQMVDSTYISKKMLQIRGRVSIVLPAYENSEGVLAAFESILRQTYGDMEVIIIDELQNTELEQKIRAIYLDYLENHRECGVKDFIFFKLPRKVGYPWICNIGAYLALGEYVVFHSDNGISESHKIEKQVEFLKDNFMYAAVGTNFSPDNDWIKFDDDINTSYLYAYEPCVNLNTLMLRSDLINVTGGMNQNISGREDFEFILRLVEDNHRVHNIREILYYEDGKSAKQEI